MRIKEGNVLNRHENNVAKQKKKGIIVFMQVMYLYISVKYDPCMFLQSVDIS